MQMWEHIANIVAALGQQTPPNQITQKYIPASVLQSVLGTPNMAPIGSGQTAWMLDAATTEGVAALMDYVPSWWKTFSIDVMWAPTDNAAGNVQFDLSWGFTVSGVVLVGGTYVSGATNLAASPVATNKLQAKNLAATLTNIPGSLPFIRILRGGAAAGDTYTADVALLGIWLRKVS